MTTWDPAAKSARITLSGGDLIATSDATANYQAVLSTTFKSTGKWYAEVTVGSYPGGSWQFHIGIAKSGASTSAYIGANTSGYGYDPINAEIRYNGSALYDTANSTAAAQAGNVIGVLFDADAHTLEFTNDGVSVAYTVTGVSADSWCFAISMYGTGACDLTANFGASAWAYAPPAGYAGPDETTVDATAPVLRLVTGTNDIEFTLPTATLVATLPRFGVEGTAPAPTLSAALAPGTVSTIEGAAPAPELSSVLSPSAFITFDRSSPAPTLVSSGHSGPVITVVRRASTPLIVATLVNPSIITLSLEAPAPRLVSVGYPGAVITAELAAATPILSAAGYPAYTITFAGTVPVPVLSAYCSGVVTEAYRTWVLNTRNRALTEYDNFLFNSFAVFNGYVVAAGSSGVVTLGTQSLDNATAITARVRTGKESFGMSVHKRVPRIYTGLITDGDMTFRTITNEGGARSYLLGTNHATGLQQRRVPVGKGPRSRFWSFEIENVAGSDFSVNDILVKPVALRRRVQ